MQWRREIIPDQTKIQGGSDDPPTFYFLAAAAVVIVVAAVAAKGVAAATAAVAEEQNQNDDPPPVIVQAAADPVIVTHKITSIFIFLSGSPLIPCYSRGAFLCKTKASRIPLGKRLAKGNYLAHLKQEL